jgi:hypothetical protein
MKRYVVLGSIAMGLAACTASEGASESATMDASWVDAPDVDAARVADASPDSTVSTVTDDAGGDGRAGEGGAGDAGEFDAGCNYIDMVPFVVDCGGVFSAGTSWVNVAGTTLECPVYYSLLGQNADSEGAVIARAGCSAECVYHASISVDLVFCGHRFGYDQLEAASDAGACPSIVAVAGAGFYGSFDEYAAKHPCPDAGGDGG